MTVLFSMGLFGLSFTLDAGVPASTKPDAGAGSELLANILKEMKTMTAATEKLTSAVDHLQAAVTGVAEHLNSHAADLRDAAADNVAVLALADKVEAQAAILTGLGTPTPTPALAPAPEAVVTEPSPVV